MKQGKPCWQEEGQKSTWAYCCLISTLEGEGDGDKGSQHYVMENGENQHTFISHSEIAWYSETVSNKSDESLV